MTLNFDANPIQMTCPKCEHKFEESVGRLKDDPALTCPGYGATILIKADGLRDGLEKAEKSLADLARSIGKLGR